MAVEEHVEELEGSPVAWRAAPGPALEERPVLYLHSIPTDSADWDPFLVRTGGLAVDLPGFGRSGKGGHLQYSLDACAAFVVRFLDERAVGRVRLVGHGWGGAVGLLVAARWPALVERLALIDPVPLMAGVRYPRVVQRLRRPLLGELLMGSMSRRRLARVLRHGSATPEAWSEEGVTRVWERFDQGTQRAILRLLRSVDEEGLAGLGLEARELGLPVLVAWGELDPWLDVRVAASYAEQLRGELVRVPEAGHWPWLDRPELVERVSRWI